MGELGGYLLMLVPFCSIVSFTVVVAIVTKERRVRNWHLMRERCPDCQTPCVGITLIEDRGYGDIAVRKWSCDRCGFYHEVL